MFGKLFGTFSHDIGIDLGTANTLAYVRSKGIVINEPSVVAINEKTNQILAIGEKARKMVGKTPSHIVARRPLVDGVVSDFEVTEAMLKYYIDKIHEETFTFFPRPRAVIGIPSGVTEVEKRAVLDAAKIAGAREVFLIEEPMAAAIGSRMPIQDPAGNVVVDIGGGTTEIAVISLGGIVISKSLRLAGDQLNTDIILYCKERYNLLIGERTAENVKIQIGSAYPLKERLKIEVRGRDLISGLPRRIIVDNSMIHEAISKTCRNIAESVQHAIEQTPPELVADIMQRGIMLAGGGALLRGLDYLIHEYTDMPVFIVDDPLTCVVRGTGIVLDDLDNLKEVLVDTEEGGIPV
jgi:rod shape-determining protein MreB